MGFDSPARLACWYTPVSDGTVFDGVVGMSGGHCTHPTGGPAIRLKHKKTSYCRLFIVGIFFFLLHDEMTLAVSKDALCFVKQRENQIIITIGALLHYTDVEL